MQADVEHIEYVQGQENYRFEITPVGGSMGKTDRILRLQPQLEANRWWFPHHIHYQNYKGENKDLIEEFLVEEYDCFPVPVHDDFLDMLARNEDIELIWPKPIPERKPKDRYSMGHGKRSSMGMGG